MKNYYEGFMKKAKAVDAADPRVYDMRTMLRGEVAPIEGAVLMQYGKKPPYEPSLQPYQVSMLNALTAHNPLLRTSPTTRLDSPYPGGSPTARELLQRMAPPTTTLRYQQNYRGIPDRIMDVTRPLTWELIRRKFPYLVRKHKR